MFKGDFKRALYRKVAGERCEFVLCDETSNYFLDLDASGEYWLEVIEDPSAGIGAEGLNLRAGPLKAVVTTASLTSGNMAFKDISAQLRTIETGQLHSEEAKDLRERRDIEDILFSSNRGINDDP